MREGTARRPVAVLRSALAADLERTSPRKRPWWERLMDAEERALFGVCGAHSPHATHWHECEGTCVLPAGHRVLRSVDFAHECRCSAWTRDADAPEVGPIPKVGLDRQQSAVQGLEIQDSRLKAG